MSEREPGAGYGQTPEAAVEYRVEVVCRMLRLSPAKLRRYEAHGLVEPRRRGRADGPLSPSASVRVAPWKASSSETSTSAARSSPRAGPARARRPPKRS